MLLNSNNTNNDPNNILFNLRVLHLNTEVAQENFTC